MGGAQLRPSDVPAPIVLLEDDRTTAALIRQVLAATNIANPLHHYTSGIKAVEHLEQPAQAGPAAVLVILDLWIPDLSGLDVLKRIRARPELVAVPVVMLSGSGDDADIELAYEIGIDAYLVKPAGIHGLPDIVRRLGLPYLLLPRRNGR
jgi:DNA-binding response OmpR family regulator